MKTIHASHAIYLTPNCTKWFKEDVQEVFPDSAPVELCHDPKDTPLIIVGVTIPLWEEQNFLAFVKNFAEENYATFSTTL